MFWWEVDSLKEKLICNSKQYCYIHIYGMLFFHMKRHLTSFMKSIFRHRKYMLLAWWLFLLVIGYWFLFYSEVFSANFQGFFLLYPVLWYVLYFILISLRGLTFIPLTSILLIMIPFTNHRLLLTITLLGTIITSCIIYYFSQALEIDEYFEKKHPRTIKKLHRAFEKYEFPIIVWWSLFPFTPTDLICYIAGSLKVNIHKMLLGIMVGEGIICAVYIWWINSLLS